MAEVTRPHLLKALNVDLFTSADISFKFCLIPMSYNLQNRISHNMLDIEIDDCEGANHVCTKSCDPLDRVKKFIVSRMSYIVPLYSALPVKRINLLYFLFPTEVYHVDAAVMVVLHHYFLGAKPYQKIFCSIMLINANASLVVFTLYITQIVWR
ncbi:hypothetical protein RIF29_22714 [Crotalaria pallida]|uniref:Uncharacterized protein n=1 Tax=Crotalaria pallida TaxID=3830 RepID=A0AAN9F981_CROPI